MSDVRHLLGRRQLLIHASALTLAAVLPAVHASGFPSKPITLVVPFGAGGVADVTARTVAKSMASALGQPVVVDNRPSAGGIAATSAVAHARADGHSLLLISNATAISATLFPQQPADVLRDLSPISTLGHFDLAVCVAAGSAYQSLEDLRAFAKAHPGQLTIGTIAIGSTQHLTAELFKTRTGIDALVVPYRSSPDVLTALRGGEIDLAIDILSPVLPHIKADAIRALAVTAATRHPLLPDVPTALEAGVQGFEVSSWNALAAPKDTPEPVIEALNAATRQALASSDVLQLLATLGIRPQAAALLTSETTRWRSIIDAADIRLD